METDEVTVTAFFTPTKVQARELPSATVCALTSRLPAEASGLDGQDAMGEAKYGEGDHKIESMQSANQPTTPGLDRLDLSSEDSNNEVFKVSWLGVWRQK